MLHPRPSRRAASIAARALLIFILHSLLFAPAHAELTVTQSRKLDPILRQAIERYEQGVSIDAPSRGLSASSALFAWPTDDGAEARIPCWIHFDPGASLPEWLEAKVSAPGRARSRMTVAQVERLASEEAVERIIASTRTRPLLDASVAEVGATWVHDPHGDPPVYGGYTGAGVLLGVVDTGVDLEHEDLRADGQTRLESLWDQTASALSAPSGFSYGREWSAAEINAGGSNERDTEGHGTHVMAIAGGDGSATGLGKPAYRFVGMAPQARLIAVKTDFYTASVVDAVQYIFDRATALGVPAVVNLSLGHHFGPHDGTEDTDRALAALAGPGRIIVAATGNEQALGIHAEGTYAASDSLDLTLQVDGYLPHAGANNDYLLIDGYYTQASPMSITVITPSGKLVGPIHPGAKVDQATVDGGVYIENDWVDPATEDRELFIQIYDKLASNSPVSGVWTLRVHGEAQAESTGELDLWIYQASLEARFLQGMSAEELISSPASSDSVIAVGAYITKKSWKSRNGNTYQYSGGPSIGESAPFSSHGPRRDGELKPDLCAPGMAIGSALSSDALVAEEYILDDGVHAVDQGPSMAAPHVSGLVTLMLQVHGPLSKSAALRVLRESARGDQFATGLPNPIWGAGKVDAIGATAQETGVVLNDVRISRNRDGTLLEWDVQVDAASLEFRVMRVDGEGNEELIAEVGPGPHYVLLDPPRANARETAYWLIALEAGRPLARFGPYVPIGDAPALDFDFPAPRPNPTRNGVSGTVRVPSEGRLRMEVMDASGRRVKSWELSAFGPGNIEYRWDGRLADARQAPTGIYWLRASIGMENRTHRILLLRK